MTDVWMIAGFFGLVMAVITGAGYVFVLRPALQTEGRAPAPPTPSILASGQDASSWAVLVDLIRRAGEAIPVSEAEARALRKRLVSAGYRSASIVPLFYGLKCASALLSTLVFGWTVFLVQESWLSALLPAAVAGAFGYTLPDRILRSLIKSRADRVRRALPDAIDLLVLCVEAGHSLDQALIDASIELKHAYPDLSGELALAHLELRAGTSRADALRNLANRSTEPELRKLTTLLIQSDRFGTSLGPALRTHAKYLRIRAKQRAEEAARKISIKLLFPIFFLIFPCMMMVTAGPAILQIFTQLLPMLTGE